MAYITNMQKTHKIIFLLPRATQKIWLISVTILQINIQSYNISTYCCFLEETPWEGSISEFPNSRGIGFSWLEYFQSSHNSIQLLFKNFCLDVVFTDQNLDEDTRVLTCSQLLSSRSLTCSKLTPLQGDAEIHQFEHYFKLWVLTLQKDYCLTLPIFTGNTSE